MSDGINLRNKKVSKDVGGCWRMWSLNGALLLGRDGPVAALAQRFWSRQPCIRGAPVADLLAPEAERVQALLPDLIPRLRSTLSQLKQQTFDLQE